MKAIQISANKKYVSRNPISQLLVNRFNQKIRNIILGLEFSNIVDIGCGEGVVLRMLEKEVYNRNCIGIDIDSNNIKLSKKNVPFCKFKVGNIYNLPFNKNSFEVVMCLEVLEHLYKPEEALSALYELSSKYVIISVPREPIWRVLNMLRGKYWKDLGNTPGHVNHWSLKKIILLLKKYFKIVDVYKPIPWALILAEKK